jgi:hypothetical protein
MQRLEVNCVMLQVRGIVRLVLFPPGTERTATPCRERLAHMPSAPKPE